MHNQPTQQEDAEQSQETAYVKPSEHEGKFGIGDKMTFYVDGKPIEAEVVQAEDVDGVVVQTSERVNGHLINQYTREELDALTAPPQQANDNADVVSPKTPEAGAEVQNETEEEKSPDELPAFDGDKFNETHPADEIRPTEEQKPNEENDAVEASTSSKIPQDESGEYDYMQAEPSKAWAALLEQTEGDADMAREVAQSMLNDKVAELEEAQKQKPKERKSVAEKIAARKEHKANIERIESEIERWRQIIQSGEEREAEEKSRSEEADETPAVDTKPESGVDGEEKSEDMLQPIGKGVFGNIYDQFKGKVKEAFDFLTKHKSGDLLGVFHRDGFGDIDLVWGDNGGGLAHIIQRHVEEQNDFNSVEEVRDVIDDVIKNGKIVRENADKVNIDYNGYRVSVRKNVRDGQGNIVENKNWVVTAFDRNTPKHEKRRTSSSETLSTPSANQEADGVTLPSNDNSPESKDTKSKTEGQEKSEESKETSLSEQISTASAEVNTNPTEAQKEAGNFKKGHVQVGTFDITIEQPQGSIRRGKDANGKKWESKMHNTYGYFRGTEGVDGDHIDVFLSNDIDGWNGRKVFVVDQYNPDGTFDEHKVMLGFNDVDEAKSDYLANYEKGWENGRRIDVTPVSLEDFEKWIGSSHRKTKAFAEYAGVKKETEEKPLSEKGGKVPFHKAGESNMELTKAEVALRDAVIDQLRENGIDVVTDVSEGQRVLDMANGNGEETRLMSVDERKERIEQINKISPERVEDKPTTRKEARSAYAELKPVEKDGATVEFYNSAFGKAWHGEDCLFGKIIPKIREIFKSSVLAYSETDNLGGKLKPDGTIHKKHPNIKAFHNYVGKVIIGNKPYYVRFTVQEGTDAKQGTHNFFVSDISLYNNAVKNVTTDTNNTLGNTNTDGIVDAKLKNFFETSDGDGQKFSYHRVYHGSGADFFNEGDAKIVDKVRFFKTQGGEAYGFTVGGKIYIDPRIASSETSVHEYAHLWAEALRSSNAKEWGNVVGLMRGTSVWNEVSERYPELKSDDERKERIEQINKISPERVEDKPTTRKEARSAYAELKPVEKDGATVEFYNSAFGKAWHGEDCLFGKIIPKIREIFKSSVLAYSETDNLGGKLKPDGTIHKKHPNIKAFHNYVGKVIIGNKPYYVRFTVQEGTDAKQGTHNFFVSDISLYNNAVKNVTTDTNNTLGNTNTDGIVDAKLKNFFETSDGDGQKFSYHRVYHGSGADFFNEGDAKIVDKVRFFKTQGGEAYGFTVGGKIYIDPRIASSETSVHEYAHLWAEALRSSNAKEWGNVVGLMRGTSVWNEVSERYPELKSDDEIADEVLATYSGRRGSERLREEMDRIKGSERSVADKARALGALERVKRALDRFWHGVADFLGIHYKSADEVADRVMRDLLNGVDPRRFVRGESIKENVTKNERTLAGVHNITEEKLRKALKLGGLANPSVAVIDTEKQAHSGFGEISLIAPSSLVNKRTGRNAGTFFGDAWTPTYPQVERIFGKGGSDRAIADIASVPEEMQRMTRNAIDSFMDGKNAENLVYLYLQEKGIAPQLFKTKGVFSPDIQKKVISLTNGQPFYKLNETERNKVVELYIEYKFDGNRDAFEKALQERVAKLTELQNEYKNPKSLLAIRVKEHLENIDNYGYDYEAIGRFVDDVNRDAKVSGKVSDIETMQEARNIVEKENLQKDFEQWKESLADRYNTKEVIFDGFTPSGNRRYVDNTLENVSKIMKRKGRNGAEGFGFSFNNFAANIMQSSGTLKGIKERKAQLTQQHEDIDAFIDKWAEVYNHLADALNPNADISTMDVGYYRLQETAVQKDPKEFAKKEYGVELSDEDVQQLNDMVKAIREERPTMYFETKFERPVMFNEFKAAVVPNNVSDEVRKALEQSGLTIFTYDPNVKGDRQRATNEAMQSSDDIRFQKVGKENQIESDKIDREYLQAVKEGDMEKAQRMVNEAAKRAGYTESSDYQGTSAFNGSAPYGNGWYLTKEERKEAWENDEWDGDSSLGDYIDNGVDGGNIEDLTNGYSYRAADPMRKEAIENVRDVVENKRKTITMYRSVPSSVKEGHFRNGDWVTPSKEYAVDNARIHGWGNDYRIIEQEVPVDDVWFDGNDIAEWGYGRAEDVANEKDFGYKNTKNNRKLLDPVTYDDSGNVIPLSERFNEGSGDVRFRDEVDGGAVSSSGVDGMRERAVELGRELGADVDVVSDVSEITDPNPEVQERKRRAKGWYDAKTGRVVINLAAHSDMADVEQTLLHEIVGHRGLRGLVGHENFNGFLDGIYEHASGVVREGIDDIARRKGCSKRVATEEYMSGLAEAGFADRKNAGLWQQIRQWFGDMLSRAKIKLNFSISDNELRYLLWRSHELSRMNGREGVVGRARDLAMQNRLGVGNGVRKGGESAVDSYDGDLETLFRDADSPVDYERALIRDSYERRLKDVRFQSREALQDGMLSLKETMKDIWRSAGKKFSQITDIPDYANPYIGQNRLSSRNAAEVRDFKHNLFRPLLREVGRLTGFSADGRAKLTDYMMAKHGLERNKVMAERVAKHPNSLTCGP